MPPLHYCKKCGRIVQKSGDVSNHKCDCCESILFKVPEKYWLDGLNFSIDKKSEQLLRDELVKPSPEFDPCLFEHRDEILFKRHQELYGVLESVIASSKDNKFGVECPYCHATNVKKISGFSKAGNVALFGVFAMGKVSKQWHCNNCGSDF